MDLQGATSVGHLCILDLFLRVIFSPGSQPRIFPSQPGAVEGAIPGNEDSQALSALLPNWLIVIYYFWLGNFIQSLCLSQSHLHSQGMGQGWAQRSRGCLSHSRKRRDEERGLEQGLEWRDWDGKNLSWSSGREAPKPSLRLGKPTPMQLQEKAQN